MKSKFKQTTESYANSKMLSSCGHRCGKGHKTNNNAENIEDVILFWFWTNEGKMANEIFITFTDSWRIQKVINVVLHLLLSILIGKS